MTDPRKAKSLEHDAVVLVHAGNVPLLSAESVNACETKLDS